ncbi:MAG: DUF1772 domain-containing protein [Alphaproteobacteria bacterium]|nr:DUF1772 domain-containing protein [Alphaproteobacteria bacterium]
MFEHLPVYLIAIAALFCWLVAGVFFAFSDFVMRSLNKLPPEQAIPAMQNINSVVYRSVFLTSLFALMAASVLFIGYGAFWRGAGSGLLVAAGLLYLGTVVGVSAIGNIPLNNRLAKANPTSPHAVDIWRDYFARWSAWNHLRTVGATVTAFLMTLASIEMV